jgi:hypothetical protein
MRQIKLDRRSFNGLTEAEKAVHQVGTAHAPVLHPAFVPGVGRVREKHRLGAPLDQQD